MKKSVKIISCLLAAILVCGTLPLCASAVGVRRAVNVDEGFASTTDDIGTFPGVKEPAAAEEAKKSTDKKNPCGADIIGAGEKVFISKGTAKPVNENPTPEEIEMMVEALKSVGIEYSNGGISKSSLGDFIAWLLYWYHYTFG